MPKAAVVQQRQREHEKKLRRRKFLKIGGVSSLLALVAGGIGYQQLRSVPYEEALKDPDKRDRYAKQFEKDLPDYIRVQYANAEVLQYLKSEIDYTPPDEAFAATMPRRGEEIATLDTGLIGNGAESTIYLLSEAFNPLYDRRDIAPSMGKVIDNVIKNHEALHAKQFRRGIEGIPKDTFVREDGEFNAALFVVATEVLGYASEHNELHATTRFERLYKEGLSGLAQANYRMIVASPLRRNMSVEKMQIIADNINPQKLLR